MCALPTTLAGGLGFGQFADVPGSDLDALRFSAAALRRSCRFKRPNMILYYVPFFDNSATCICVSTPKTGPLNGKQQTHSLEPTMHKCKVGPKSLQFEEVLEKTFRRQCNSSSDSQSKCARFTGETRICIRKRISEVRSHGLSSTNTFFASHFD